MKEGIALYKTNITKSKLIVAMKDMLLSDEILFEFNVLSKPNSISIVVEKETTKIEYSIYGDNQVNKAIEFLEELKDNLPDYLQEDIDCIIEEALCYAVK